VSVSATGAIDETSGEGGPVVMITGGLSGIGAAVAREFAALGARLVLVDRDLDRAPAVVAAIERAGGDAITHAGDVRDVEALRTAAGEAVRRFGRVDVLVANAGLSDQSPVATGDPARWRAVVETNLLGTIHAVHAVLPAMLERERGHVFIVSSVSGREAYPGEAVYIASKWGQVGFAHSLRQEVMDAGVRVTVVEPGIVDTPLTRENPAVRPLLDATEPLAPEDVARAVVYAYRQPPHVAISEVTIRPLRQRLPNLT
jgi:NADP-dependent 3-hydroxy acid dehydrogenase YdfG